MQDWIEKLKIEHEQKEARSNEQQMEKDESKKNMLNQIQPFFGALNEQMESDVDDVNSALFDANKILKIIYPNGGTSLRKSESFNLIYKNYVFDVRLKPEHYQVLIEIKLNGGGGFTPKDKGNYILQATEKNVLFTDKNEAASIDYISQFLIKDIMSKGDSNNLRINLCQNTNIEFFALPFSGTAAIII
jgi:hypothetical protein